MVGVVSVVAGSGFVVVGSLSVVVGFVVVGSFDVGSDIVVGSDGSQCHI